MKLPLTLSLFLATSLHAAEEAYPKSELSAEPALIAKEADADRFVILDAREVAKYKKGHVPTARWVDHAAWAKAFVDGGDADGWTERIRDLGINADSKVIVYDDAMSKDAARIWWILRYWGLKDARILNGGWVHWNAQKLPTSEEVFDRNEGEFKAVAQAEKLATKDLLMKAIGEGKLQIVDARSEKEHCGTDALQNKKAGAMPGAKNLEWTDLLDKETHRFKSPAELKTLFAAAGIALTEPTATHCQSGGRAAVMAYGMELMGAPAVRNYYKSWREWGNAADTPVVKPPAKK